MTAVRTSKRIGQCAVRARVLQATRASECTGRDIVASVWCACTLGGAVGHGRQVAHLHARSCRCQLRRRNAARRAELCGLRGRSSCFCMQSFATREPRSNEPATAGPSPYFYFICLAPTSNWPTLYTPGQSLNRLRARASHGASAGLRTQQHSTAAGAGGAQPSHRQQRHRKHEQPLRPARGGGGGRVDSSAGAARG